jgi:hypothetical protein
MLVTDATVGHGSMATLIEDPRPVVCLPGKGRAPTCESMGTVRSPVELWMAYRMASSALMILSIRTLLEPVMRDVA